MMLDEIRLTIVVVMRNGKFLEKNLKASQKNLRKNQMWDQEGEESWLFT